VTIFNQQQRIRIVEETEGGSRIFGPLATKRGRLAATDPVKVVA
jgi:hypothetical protein